jgi:hypothetical protein
MLEKFFLFHVKKLFRLSNGSSNPLLLATSTESLCSLEEDLWEASKKTGIFASRSLKCISMPLLLLLPSRFVVFTFFLSSVWIKTK